MKFLNVPFHVALESKSTFAILNRACEEFPLVLKKVAGQVVFSSIARLAVIYWTSKWPLKQNSNFFLIYVYKVYNLEFQRNLILILINNRTGFANLKTSSA